jgi:hypothetical protein
MVASAWEATPMAPAAVKTAIRQNEFEKAARLEERSLALNGSSFPVAIEAPSPSTRIIPESQPLKFSVAEEIRVHQQKAFNSGDFAPSVAKKPHIPLNGQGNDQGNRQGFPSSGTFRQSLHALHNGKRR